MKNLNKSLKIAGIGYLSISAIQILFMFTDVFLAEMTTFVLIEEIVKILLSFVTGTIYLIFSKKSTESILKNKNLLYTLSILSIFNNIFVWALSLYVQSNLIKEMKSQNLKTAFKIPSNEENYQAFNSNNENKNQNESRNSKEKFSNVIILGEEDYKINPSPNDSNDSNSQNK